jgi:hypothetical protein
VRVPESFTGRYLRPLLGGSHGEEGGRWVPRDRDASGRRRTQK